MKLITWEDPQLVQIIKNGGVVVAPTDTVYGMLANVADVHAVGRMLALKGREARPGTVIAGTLQQIIDLGVEPAMVEPFRRFWPAPLSVELPVPALLEYVAKYQLTFAVRIPKHDQLQNLLGAVGPLMSTSANLTGQPVVTNVQTAYEIFGDAVDAYIDGGEQISGLPSTIARSVDGNIEVLRKGAFPADKLT